MFRLCLRIPVLKNVDTGIVLNHDFGRSLLLTLLKLVKFIMSQNRAYYAVSKQYTSYSYRLQYLDLY